MTKINAEHPEFTARKAMWTRYRDLYAGGEQLKARADQYLLPRQKEAPDVYGERLQRVYYENYIGSIIDWYGATLFRREPALHIEGANEAGRRFFSGFAEDCDTKGTSITDFYRRQFIDTLVFGASYTLVDFPRTQPKTTRAEEEASGAARAYLVSYTPENLINWELDERGLFRWVVVRTLLQEETRWTYYDRENFALYRGSETRGKKAEPELIASGRHGLANLRMVPLIETRLPDGFWLMNKAALLQLEHFNKSNALSWALTMGLFATPVIYTERDFNEIVGESYYIQLGPGDRFGWTEPEGKVFQIATDNLTRLKDEIYRVCYLLTQAGGTTTVAQSGVSRLREFAITQEVLRAFGDMMKDTLKRVLRVIERAREDGLSIDVSGLDDFDIADFSGDLADAERLLSLGIESQTLKKQIFKRLAHKYMCDARQDVKDRISAEIDASFERL